MNENCVAWVNRLHQSLRGPQQGNGTYRAEGRSFLESLVNSPRYLIKYMWKDTEAQPEKRDYFAQQRRALQSFVLTDPIDSGELSVGFFGDLMPLDPETDPYFSAAALTAFRTTKLNFGNLETQVLEGGKTKPAVTDFIRFATAPDSLSPLIRRDESDPEVIVSVANNHAMDFGASGLQETVGHLDAAGIHYDGLSGRPVKIVERGGIRFGFFAATWGVNHLDSLQGASASPRTIPGFVSNDTRDVDLTSIQTALKEMETAKVDIKIVSLHWGFEFEMFPTDRAMAAAREISALGADIILGHHPHVVQPMEILYNGRGLGIDASSKPSLDEKPTLVMYSLGNFIGEDWTEYGRIGPLVRLRFKRVPSGQVRWSFDQPDYFFTPSKLVKPDGRSFLVNDRDFPPSARSELNYVRLQMWGRSR